MNDVLASQFDWRNHPPSPLQLCLYAVIIARLESNKTSQHPIDNLITTRLAEVLALGFSSMFLRDLLSWDVHFAAQELDRRRQPFQRARLGRVIGDRCLFVTGLHYRYGRTDRHGPSLATFVNLGQHAYRLVGQHATRRINRDTDYFLYNAMAEMFTECRDLLTKAGDVLGLDPDIDRLLHISEPQTTIDDVLDAVSAAEKEPSPENFQRLAQLTTDPQWRHIILTFKFTDPPTT